jgi:hypothetical protein
VLDIEAVSYIKSHLARSNVSQNSKPGWNAFGSLMYGSNCVDLVAGAVLLLIAAYFFS